MNKIRQNQIPDGSPISPVKLSVADGYDLWSEVYDTENNPLIALEERYLFPKLDMLDFSCALDAGCGTGRITRQLQEQPGANVFSIDISRGMIRKARDKKDLKSAVFSIADLTMQLPFKPATFDLIVSSLVIEHIPSVVSFLAHLKQVALPNARIIITGLHPTMQKLGVQARFQKESGGKHYLPQAYHQKISDYINAAIKNNLKIVKLEEFEVDAELVKNTPKAAKYKGWPLLFILELENGS